MVLYSIQIKKTIFICSWHIRECMTHATRGNLHGVPRDSQQFPFLCRKQRHYLECSRTSATPRAGTLPSSAVAASLSLRIARINPPTCSFSAARVPTLEKPDGPVDQKLDVTRYFLSRPQAPNRTPRGTGGGLGHGAPLDWWSGSRFISTTRLSFPEEQFHAPEKRVLRSHRVIAGGSSGYEK